MNFRTRNGITTFYKDAIAAYTSTKHQEIEVHLCSGTIFTVCKEESDKFIRWIKEEEGGGNG
tara:strand:+ start:141 stop:326 length:186 start_codon:yes stop_codon:yes gene_type:complete